MAEQSRAESMVHVVRPDDGIVGPLRILASSEHTQSLYFALEWETAPAPAGRPLGWHSHEEHDESEYVVTGEREIFSDEQRWQGGSGLFVLSPRRSVHTMRTLAPDPSMWLHFFSPAGLEKFFVQREHLRARGASAAEIRSLGEQYGILTAPTRPAVEQPFVSAPDTRLDGVVVTGDSTRNAYALAERTALPSELHAHEDQEEAFYVLDGELVVEAESLNVALPARSFVLIPRGVRHHHVLSPGAQVLAVFSPGHQVPH